jgi:hypothetical protein
VIIHSRVAKILRAKVRLTTGWEWVLPYINLSVWLATAAILAAVHPIRQMRQKASTGAFGYIRSGIGSCCTFLDEILLNISIIKLK